MRLRRGRSRGSGGGGWISRAAWPETTPWEGWSWGVRRRGYFRRPVSIAPAEAVPISRSLRLRLRGTASCSMPPSSCPAPEQLPDLGVTELLRTPPASCSGIKAGEADDGLGEPRRESGRASWRRRR